MFSYIEKQIFKQVLSKNLELLPCAKILDYTKNYPRYRGHVKEGAVLRIMMQECTCKDYENGNGYGV